MIDRLRAVEVAEGTVEPRDEAEVVEAWQYLHDTGLAYRLQGWFGRRARHLVEAGVLTP